MLLQLIMLFLQLVHVSLLIITCDVPVFYVKYCKKKGKYLSEVSVNKN